MPRVVVIAGDQDWLVPHLRAASERTTGGGKSYAFLTRESSAEALSAALSEAEALIARPSDVLAVQSACPNLKFVQFTTCDYDQAVLAELQARRLMVVGLGAALAGDVAAVAVGLMLALDSGASGASGPVRPTDPRWAQLLEKLRGRTVGIIGLGRVGTAVARLLQPTGAHLMFSDVRTTPQALSRELYGPGQGQESPRGPAQRVEIRRSTQDRLLVESEFVTVHVPVTDQSRNLLSRREFGLLTARSVLINTSAPDVIDRSALVPAIKEKRIRGFGTTTLDPGLAGQKSVVFADPKVLTTPEVASRVAAWIVGNVDAAVDGKNGRPQGIVETIGYPRSGDPAFWSSRMSPRETVQ